jgi:hypothetical protein
MAKLNLDDEKTIEYAWNQGLIVEDYDSSLFRKDAAGAWISRSEYGNRDSKFGWEIDHIYPTALGGDNDEKNLRPMQWENNVSKGDNYPDYVAVVAADGNQNVDKQSSRTINSSVQERLQALYSL